MDIQLTQLDWIVRRKKNLERKCMHHFLENNVAHKLWILDRVVGLMLKHWKIITILQFCFLIHSCGVWYRLNLILNIKRLICCECKMECFTWNPVFFFLVHSLKIYVCLSPSFVVFFFTSYILVEIIQKPLLQYFR